MAASDPLLLLRASIAAARSPVFTTSSDPTTAQSSSNHSLVAATHLYFAHPTPQCLPLTSPTRFTSTAADTAAVDLRSIFFAWQQKDVTVPEYIASATELNNQLPQGQEIRNLVFVERIDLITWLEGASDESEYIKPLEGDDAGLAHAANRAADVAGGTGVPTVAGTGVGVTQQTTTGRPVKVIDARLQEIYNGERKMGDRNTVLRGIKPTDFSHVRKHAESFLGRHRKPLPNAIPRTNPSARPSSTQQQLANRPAPSLNLAKSLSSSSSSSAVSSKRSDPIILLSPSASSLLRMSNIKSFLDSGLFVPPDHPTLSSQTTANLLHITRPLKSLSDTRPIRFILVDSPEHFKPDYWSRVVAVFTTGQVWQFRGYKWREPQELFGHVLGIYVGETSSPIPAEVKGWGSSVKAFQVERWDERAHGVKVEPREREARRWKDREVVEDIWRTLEGYMRGKGEWKR